MKPMKRFLCLLLCGAIILSLIGCNLPFFGNNNDAEKSRKEDVETIDTNFKANTNVSYSSGSDSNWSYGNQRKEFPQNEACYVRISSTVIAEKRKGIGTDVTVTYRFTGANNCKIELSDGIATQIDSDDPNIIMYSRVISADKESKATESLVIFQYTPNSDATNIALEVLYDDHVPAQHDVRNTIYFSASK